MYIKRIKRKLYFLICKNVCLKSIFIYLNLILFHWNERQRYIHLSKKSDKTIYIIKPRSVNEGLLSLYYYVMANIKWAYDKGYDVYVDFSDQNCQYHVDRLIDGTDNAWNYYFKQPMKQNKNDIYSLDCNLLVSGWTLKNHIKLINKDLVSITSVENMYISRYIIPVKEELDKSSIKEYNRMFQNKSVLGVFIRGTDYVALKPQNHPIQPTIDDLIKKVDEFLSQYDIDFIYFVSEDYSYYKIFCDKYGDKLVSFDNQFVNNYSKKSYVNENMTSDPYERGKSYLMRLLILSKCDYLISSVTNGSLFVKSIQETKCVEEYWFELGYYQ